MASCKLCGVHFFPNTSILPRKFQRDVPERLFLLNLHWLRDYRTQLCIWWPYLHNASISRDRGKLACFTANLLFKHSTNSTNFLRKEFQEYHRTASMFPQSSLLKKCTRKKGRSEQNSKKFLCGLPVSAVRDKHQLPVRCGSSLRLFLTDFKVTVIGIKEIAYKSILHSLS